MSSEATAGQPEGRAAALLDPAVARATTDLVEAVARALKTLRLYAPDNPVHQQALDNVALRLSRFVDETGPLSLGVARDHLHLSGTPVYRDDGSDGLCARLHADGVRAVAFQDGLEVEEAGKAVALLAQGTGLALEDDDLVTLFWEAGLPHVRITAVADDPPLPSLGAGHAAGSGGVEAAAEQLARQPIPPRPLVIGADALAAFELTPRDEAHLDRLIARETALDPAQELAGIVADVLAIEDDAEAFTWMAGLYGGFVVEALARGQFAVATRQLDTLLNLGVERPGVAAVLSGLAGGEGLAALSDGVGRVFGSGEPEPRALDDLGGYLGRLPGGDPSGLLGAAVAVHAGPVREALLEAAARSCDGAALLPLATGDDMALAVCALQVLGRVGAEADVAALGGLASHSEMDVRRAAVEAVAAICPAGHPMLLPFLADAETAVRRRALLLVADASYADALEPLRALVAGPLFESMRMGEKRAVFATIGTLGGDAVLPFFAPHLKSRRRLWGKRKGEETALCAVSGVKAVGTAAALELLKAGGRHHNERVRAACGFALRELEGTL